MCALLRLSDQQLALLIMYGVIPSEICHKHVGLRVPALLSTQTDKSMKTTQISSIFYLQYIGKEI